MKVILLALAVFSAGVAAAPEDVQSRFVDGIIIGAINDLSQNIRDQGLDPLYVPYEAVQYKVPVTDLFSAEAYVVNLLVEGLSNIRINNIDFSILATRLRFDISLPLIDARLGSASANAILGNWDWSASADGALAIRQIRVTGEVRVNIGIISGVSIRDLRIDFTLGGVYSNLNVVLLGKDVSEPINNVLGEVIPDFILEFRHDINAILEYIVESIVEDLL